MPPSTVDILSIEAEDSRELRLNRLASSRPGRELKKAKPKHKSEEEIDFDEIERAQEQEYLDEMKWKKDKDKRKAEKKHKKLLREVYADPGIRSSTVHGMMIDAGSTGSRLHLYEWEPRILKSGKEVEEAVAGRKLSYPESASQWTDRLRPGVATFASLPDDELLEGIADYLSPLIEFSKTVLREKEDSFGTFPIFFRATAGMRVLKKEDRFRVLSAVRTLFSNNTFCPFYFEHEYARILSGEEEAIFGWTGINFVMGNLVKESEGAGTVLNPNLTYGALDMGGASTQISFYEPNEDIMANLFKLQIGQGKHWNLYAHSFLYYGLNEARNRFQAHLLAGKDESARLVDGVYNPCLPGGSMQAVRLNIHINSHGLETWNASSGSTDDGYYQALLVNNLPTSDFDLCMDYAKRSLHLEQNTWCEFAHHGECAFNGVAMSELPTQSRHFGEFLAFSNYYHVWNYLELPERASLQQLYDATRGICALSKDQLLNFNDHISKGDTDEVIDLCFRSSYTFNILRYGYGFEMDEYVTATNVLSGQKVGWALGAMLYEINTFPWEYASRSLDKSESNYDTNAPHVYTGFVAFGAIVGITFSVLATLILQRQRRHRQYYEPLKDAKVPSA